MKKLIIYILAFVFLSGVSFASDLKKKIIAKKKGGGAVACAKDSGTLVMDESSMDQDGELSLGSDANGQSISYAANWKLWSIELHFGASTNADCRATVRIGTAKDLSTYMEEWTGINPGVGGSLKELLSVDQDAYSSSTTYYIGFIETAGSCTLYYDSTTPPYAGGSRIGTSSVWTLGSDLTARDYHINVYKTTDVDCE